MALDRTAGGAATFHDAPVSVDLSVLVASMAAQEHGPAPYPETGIPRQGGRSAPNPRLSSFSVKGSRLARRCRRVHPAGSLRVIQKPSLPMRRTRDACSRACLTRRSGPRRAVVDWASETSPVGQPAVSLVDATTPRMRPHGGRCRGSCPSATIAFWHAACLASRGCGSDVSPILTRGFGSALQGQPPHGTDPSIGFPGETRGRTGEITKNRCPVEKVRLDRPLPFPTQQPF